MVDFEQDITNFRRQGIYNYQFDVAGNEILNPSASAYQQIFFAIPLSNANYDQTRILSYYDPTFTEFVRPVTSSVEVVVSTQELQDQLLLAQDQNQVLTAQLSELITANEQVSSPATDQLIKDTIIGLRVSLGQGKLESDFTSEFPYFPLPADIQPSQILSSQ